MGGFGALNLGRHKGLFCAVGGHSAAVLENDDFGFGFDNLADFNRNDLIKIAKTRSPYDAPVWIDVGDQDELGRWTGSSRRSYTPAARTSPSTSGPEATTATTGTSTSTST